MKLIKKDLFFFTRSYPYGNGEAFIENELNFLAPFFETIYLFHKSKTESKRKVPSNVKLIYIEPPTNKSKKYAFKKNSFLFLTLVWNEFLFSRQKKMFINNLKYNLSHILNCIYYSNEIKTRVENQPVNNSYFYSYWFFDWNFSLSILKSKRVIKKNYTRAHRFDLYEETEKSNYLPLRRFCLKNTDKVFAISRMGENYLKSIYPKFKNKLFCSYLGTKDFGVNPKSVVSSPIHIVSCSNVNQVKRVHLIIETLGHIKIPAKWTHIGDGALLQKIKISAEKLPNNIITEFKGSLSQIELFNFYKNEPIDIFINCSASEGIPVSIMEAISFGIPVIATNVGGTCEIVNKETGFLIEKDFNAMELAREITNLKKSESYIQLRTMAREYWKEHFFSDTNYSSFLSHFN
jgi:glycosyltransferase involved in cell wall biosynthesis